MMFSFLLLFFTSLAGGGQSSEEHGSTSGSLNVYPEASGGGDCCGSGSPSSTMLESARLCVSLEGDENFRVICTFPSFFSIKALIDIHLNIGRPLHGRCELSGISS